VEYLSNKKEIAMEEFIYVGEDFGMGANKLWSGGWEFPGERKGTTHIVQAGGLQMVSQVASNGRGHYEGMLGLKNKRRPLEIASEFGSFYVGDGAHEHGRPVENLDFDRLTGAPEMRALLYGSLYQFQQTYGKFDRPLSLMVGLPLQMMMGADAKQYQAGVKGWLKGPHQFTADGETVNIEIGQVRMTSQPVGALFDYVLDDEGHIQAERANAMLDEVGVISVGFNTVELLVVKDQGAVERFTYGNTLGVRRLLELLNRDGLWSLSEMDEKVRSGRMRDELKVALPIWAREVNGEIERRWGQSFKRFVKVIVVGGGALLLKEALTAQFGAKAHVPNLPVLSISRGLWKLSVMKR
jgi:hypothetical protein